MEWNKLSGILILYTEYAVKEYVILAKICVVSQQSTWCQQITTGNLHIVLMVLMGLKVWETLWKLM